MKRILLVGAGHAHAYLLASLAKTPLYGARLTLVSPAMPDLRPDPRRVSNPQILLAMLPSGVVSE